jgi:tripartite-type tricarboxylate transporter receptor subunit TctC
LANEDRYPSRAVRFVVPFGTGPTEVIARWFADRLSGKWRQAVVVENHPGAGGAAGTRLVAQAQPDGYTLLGANPGPLTVAPAVRTGLGYDAAADFSPIVLMVTVSGVLAAHPGVPAKSMAQLIDFARAHPGRVRYGSAGTGTVSHLAMEQLNHLAGITMTHVPREGLDVAVPELVSGEFDLLVIPLPDARPLAAEGKIRALACTRRSRSARWPELPTVEESGVAGFESFNWNGLAATGGTPPPVVARINADVNHILQSAETQAFLMDKGYEIAGGTPEAFGAFMATERVKWAEAVRLAGLQPGPE